STPDRGRVTVRGGVRVGVLSQQDEATADTTVRRRVVGDRPEFEWASDPRIRDVLSGLLEGIDLEAPLTSLSGGQLRRVHLAELLVGDWDVLLLDEPRTTSTSRASPGSRSTCAAAGAPATAASWSSPTTAGSSMR